MKEVTSILNIYRESSRNIWNIYFWNQDANYEKDGIPYKNEKFNDVLDCYEEIDRLLFSALVLIPLNKFSYKEDFKNKPLDFLKIIPNADETPIMINRPDTMNRYWDDPINVIGTDSSLSFLSYFDFDNYGYKNLEFFLLRIGSFPQYPHLVGRDALIQAQRVKIFLA